jgi:8-oxo-dGTP diphosphatase
MGTTAWSGGHLEAGESVTQAAIREYREEVGVEIDPAHLEVVGVAHYTSPTGEGVDFFLSVTRWAGQPRNLEPESPTGHIGI